MEFLLVLYYKYHIVFWVLYYSKNSELQVILLTVSILRETPAVYLMSILLLENELLFGSEAEFSTMFFSVSLLIQYV